MARLNLFNCTKESCATAPYLCQMYAHSSKWYHFWWWRGVDNLFWKLHEAYCPDMKLEN